MTGICHSNPYYLTHRPLFPLAVGTKRQQVNSSSGSSGDQSLGGRNLAVQKTILGKSLQTLNLKGVVEVSDF
ncbi:hypothetical protein LENED_005462 [Lentinula edodes]|uniref:Uncharacterized protein n=1 Tax=Lentinula edodes TaxID=5353 RepID=A0A1Q3E922_LENED|nr:hypothetical protein LENED_005462 [Lentinula edodes]